MQSVTGIRPAKRSTAEERRKEVIQAAIVEFATFGLHGGSTERIAESAGISQPYVLRLFGTKKGLFLAALDRVSDEILAAWQGSVDALERTQGGPGTPDERLMAIGDTYQFFVRDVVQLRFVLQGVSAAEDEDIRRRIQTCMKRMYEWIGKTSGASPERVRSFYAQGMMLTMAASMRAFEKAGTEEWARGMLMMPVGVEDASTPHTTSGEHDDTSA